MIMKSRLQFLSLLFCCLATTLSLKLWFFAFQPASTLYALEESESETASPSTSPNATSAATQSLKERIEKVVEEKESKNGSVIGEKSYTTRGVVGKVERVSESTITIQTLKGSVIVPITSDTELVKGSKSIKAAEIEIDNQIIALGIQTGDNFTAIKIIVTAKQLLPKNQVVVIGSLTSFTKNSLTLNSRYQNQSQEFEISKDTVLLDSEDQAIKPTDLFEDMQLIVAGVSETSSNTQKSITSALLVKSLAGLE